MRVWVNVAAAVLMCGSLALGQESAGATTRPAETSADASVPLMDELELGTNGSFEIDGLRFCILHFAGEWKGMAVQAWCKPADGYPKNGRAVYENVWLMGGTDLKFSCHEIIRGLDPHTVRYETVMTSEKGIGTAVLCMEITLPASRYRGQVLVADGEEILLPEKKPQNGWFVFKEKVRRLQIATPGGVLTVQGPVPMSFGDNGDNLTVGLRFNPDSGVITESRLKLKLSWKPLEAAEKK